MSQETSLVLSFQKANRLVASRLVDQLLTQLDAALSDPEPLECLIFDLDALRELAGHLRRLGLGITAGRLMAYLRDFVNGEIDLWLSDYATEVGPEGAEELRSFFGDFPLPLENREEQSEVQHDRQTFVEGNVRILAERLRSLRTELQELGADDHGKSNRKKTDVRCRRRAKRPELTKKQEAVVDLVETHNQSIPDIARSWNRRPQAVHQLYARALKNPAYKQRSVNLHKAKTLHANTQEKGNRSTDD